VSRSAPAVDILDEPLKAEIRAVYRRLQTNTPGFTIRRPQSQMIAAVARALGNAQPGVVEAPTGVGKSLAYLTAGVPIALAREKKLVISTGTVALQSQLVERDIPGFLAATGLSATVALAKGRTRYLCSRNIDDVCSESAQEHLFDDSLGQPLYDSPMLTSDMNTALRLHQAFDKGKWNGDLDNTTEVISAALRQRITSPSASCAGQQCTYAARCPVLQARREVREAQIVVTNHALLLAALGLSQGNKDDAESSSTGGLLAEPSEMLLVIDEAHHIGSAAIGQGEASVGLDQMARRIGRLPPLVNTVYTLVERDYIAALNKPDALALVSKLSVELRRFSQMLRAELGDTKTDDTRDAQWRATHGILPNKWKAVISALHSDTRSLLDWVMKAIAALPANPSHQTSALMVERLQRSLGATWELVQQQHRLWTNWTSADPTDQPPQARWISRNHEGGQVLHGSPVSAAHVLTSLLWEQVDAVLLTSATLSHGGDFQALGRELALPQTAETLSLPSPFDLENQAQLIIPDMVAAPSDSAHPQEIAQYLDQELDWKHCSLVLFTSRRKMEKVAELLPAARRKKVLVQGETAKQKLIDKHVQRSRTQKGSVLFGLNSFGEGLDLPGAACTTVVITQVPFAVPTDPQTATLSEWYQQIGHNPFNLITLPHAQRMLTQFAGRLIRTHHDHGRIIILDNRLRTRSYGKQLLQALPPFRKLFGQAWKKAKKN